MSVLRWAWAGIQAWSKSSSEMAWTRGLLALGA
jgi:hypothetical protein